MWAALAVAMPSLGSVLVGGYLLAGVGVAAALERRGQPRGAVLGALALWPLMLPLLGAAPSAPRGPLAARIDAALSSLERTLADPVAGDVAWEADLSELRAALGAADARLALVDRLLADTPSGEADAAATALREARAEGEAAVLAVLGEVQQLRLQVGMAALAGGQDALRGRIAELSARATAWSQLG